MRSIADANGASVAQVALAWLLHQPAATSVILGARRLEQLQDKVGVAEGTLSEDDLARLDEASHLRAEHPVWMIDRQGAPRRALLDGRSR